MRMRSLSVRTRTPSLGARRHSRYDGRRCAGALLPHEVKRNVHFARSGEAPSPHFSLEAVADHRIVTRGRDARHLARSPHDDVNHLVDARRLRLDSVPAGSLDADLMRLDHPRHLGLAELRATPT